MLQLRNGESGGGGKGGGGEAYMVKMGCIA